jgi:hypothetical protein
MPMWLVLTPCCAADASLQAAALREEVQRRRSVHSDSIDSIARLQAVSQVHRQENDDLRQRVHELSEAWEQVGRGEGTASEHGLPGLVPPGA